MFSLAVTHRLTCFSIPKFASTVPLRASKTISNQACRMPGILSLPTSYSKTARSFSTHFSSKPTENTMKKTKLFGLFILCGGILAASGAYIYHADKQSKAQAPTAPDITNLKLIYDNNGYSYSLPQSILASYLIGKAFDNKELYTSEELARLKKDINAINNDILSNNPHKELLAVMTAGAPGVGKTTVMRNDLDSFAKRGLKFPYICPDDVCLKQQKLTFQVDANRVDSESQGDISKLKEGRLVAYNKWRPGSNAANHIILANLIREKYAFYFGTTSSGPATGSFFDFLKKQGYKIRLLHVSAPDNVRWESIQARDKHFVQTTEQDIKEKGLLVTQRINDTFLKYADEIKFYFRGGVDQSAQLAAVWIKGTNDRSAKLTILNEKGYAQIISIHDEACEKLGKPELYWSKTVGSSVTQANK